MTRRAALEPGGADALPVAVELINTTQVCQEEGRKIACKVAQKGDAGGITITNTIIHEEQQNTKAAAFVHEISKW